MKVATKENSALKMVEEALKKARCCKNYNILENICADFNEYYFINHFIYASSMHNIHIQSYNSATLRIFFPHQH